ncbi:MAG: hypothetical protein ABIG92_05325 [Candidatus Omnitrophota bacterium]
MKTPLYNNQKGFVLIVSYMVIAVLITISFGFAGRSIAEQRISNVQRDLTQAFWLGEAGLDMAIAALPNTAQISNSNFANLNIGSCITKTEQIDASNIYRVYSRGSVNNLIRQVMALVELPDSDSDSEDITSVITAAGDVIIKGNAQVNGTISTFATFSIEEVLGMSAEVLKSRATHYYNDPDNNILPVDGLTWVDISEGEEFRITENGWSGQNLLIVDGDMSITGGRFDGILWVIGELRISGNPIINGAIFVEAGAAEIDTTLTGTPIISYDQTIISDAFDWLPPPTAQVLSWREVTDEVLVF